MNTRAEEVNVKEDLAALRAELKELRAEVSSLRDELPMKREPLPRAPVRSMYLRGEPKQLITLRLETALLERIDRFIDEELPRRIRGSRSEAIRLLINRGLGEVS